MLRSVSVQAVTRAAQRSFSRRGASSYLAFLSLAVGAAACTGDDTTPPAPDAGVASESGAGADSANADVSSEGSATEGGVSEGAASEGGACSVTVAPGANDNDTLLNALINAQSGDTICLGRGTFHPTGQLSLTVSNVTVRGQSDSVLDFSGQSSGANGFEVTGNHDVIDTLTIRDPKGDGLRATQVDFFTARNVRVSWSGGSQSTNGGYGIYPVTSSHVLIENCFASGASDTGIYVGQSSNIIIRNNEATGNVAGIEVENSTDAEVYGNHSHGNSGGILIFNLPGLDVKDGKRANVHDNVIEDNNLDNFAAAGNIVADVPTGTGMFILAADDNEVHGNTIRNNESFGIAVVSWYITLRTAPGLMDPAFDWYPERNYVHDNTFSNNGQMPQGDLTALVLGIAGRATLTDMVWDGVVDATKLGDAGVPDGGPAADGGSPVGIPSEGGAPAGFAALENCFSNNGNATFFNFDFHTFGANKSFDVTPYACTRPALPPISF